MDIKYIKTLQGNIYLNIIRDVHSQAILSYKINTRMDYTSLVKPCLEDAIAIFSKNVAGLILHTDNGIQYRCRDFYQFAQLYKIRISKSKPGVSTDNGMAEN